MKKITITLIIILCSLVSFSQLSYKPQKIHLEQKFNVSNLYLDMPKKHKTKNELLGPATICYVGFVSILSINHFTESNRDKASDAMYGTLVGALTIGYSFILFK